MRRTFNNRVAPTTHDDDEFIQRFNSITQNEASFKEAANKYLKEPNYQHRLAALTSPDKKIDLILEQIKSFNSSDILAHKARLLSKSKLNLIGVLIITLFTSYVSFS
jgi:hypothetical protein